MLLEAAVARDGLAPPGSPAVPVLRLCSRGRSRSASTTTTSSGLRGPTASSQVPRPGLGAVRLTIPWRRGQSRSTNARIYLHRAAMLMERGQRVVIGVFGSLLDAPLDPESRQHCSFLRYVVLRIPFRDVVIWNEANSPTFWPSDAGARAYEELLATCWRRLHAVRPGINVISSTDPGPSRPGRVHASWSRIPGTRTAAPDRRHLRPQPYPENAAEPPWARHDEPSTVGQADLERSPRGHPGGIRGHATAAAAGGRHLGLVPGDGVPTTVPRDKRRFYRGAETDLYVVPRPSLRGIAAVAATRRASSGTRCCWRAVPAGRRRPSTTNSSSTRTGWPAGSPACSGATAPTSRRTRRSRRPSSRSGRGRTAAPTGGGAGRPPLPPRPSDRGRMPAVRRRRRCAVAEVLSKPLSRPHDRPRQHEGPARAGPSEAVTSRLTRPLRPSGAPSRAAGRCGCTASALPTRRRAPWPRRSRPSRR